MKVLVCGGRDYNDDEAVFQALAAIHSEKPIRVLIQGGATGADWCAKVWAEHYGIHVAEIRAQWKKYGNGAGPLRNAAMLVLQPDLVVAFPGGRGTESMCGLAEKAGIPVKRLPLSDGGSRE